MDSTRPRPAPPPSDLAADGEVLVEDAPPPTFSAEAPPPGALARLGRMLPRAAAVTRFAYRTALVSLVSAALILWAIVDTFGVSLARLDLAVLAVLLVLPAAAAALAGWTLADLAALPGDLKEAALGAAAVSRGERGKKSRLFGALRSLWAARGVALLSRGAWMKAVGALRFARLASLPFAIGTLALFAMNGVVVLGGLVALLVLVL